MSLGVERMTFRKRKPFPRRKATAACAVLVLTLLGLVAVGALAAAETIRQGRRPFFFPPRHASPRARNRRQPRSARIRSRARQCAPERGTCRHVPPRTSGDNRSRARQCDPIPAGLRRLNPARRAEPSKLGATGIEDSGRVWRPCSAEKNRTAVRGYEETLFSAFRFQISAFL
jgi:hypothetical protein